MQGSRFCSAISCARRCFLTVSGKYVPPLTVASFATITHSRPSTTPIPVTMPAPGACPSYISHAASADSSRKAVSGSQSRSIRSRAVSLPRARWRSSACVAAAARRPEPSALAAPRRAPPSARCRRVNASESRSTWELRTPIAMSLARSPERDADRLVSREEAARGRAARGARPPSARHRGTRARAGSRALSLAAASRRPARAAGASPAPSASADSAISGSTESGSSRRAQRRSLAAAGAGSVGRTRGRRSGPTATAARTRTTPTSDGDDAGRQRDARRQRVRQVARRADADDHEHGQADRRDRPDPVTPCVDGEVDTGAERTGCDAASRRASRPTATSASTPAADDEHSADQPGLAQRVELERVRALRPSRRSRPCARYAHVPAAAADARQRVARELVEGDAPEVVAVRAELAEVARRRCCPGRGA